MSSLPSITSPVFCTDEDVCVAAGSDFTNLIPASQLMATGTDGVFLSSTPWVLSSASINFGACGVNANQVVRLSGASSLFKGTGQLLAIDSVSLDGTSLTLRRLHKDLNIGMPPGPAAGVTGVTFTIATFDPQIEEATYDLKRRFFIDETVVSRASSWIYDLRELRMATVWTVLRDRYAQEARTGTGDYPMKYAMAKTKLTEILDRIQVRWGPLGNSAEPATLFTCKVTR